VKRNFVLGFVTLLLALWGFAVAGWPAAAGLSIMAALLVLLADEDVRSGELPNMFTLALFVTGIGLAPFLTGILFEDSVEGAVLGAGLAAVVMASSAKITGRAGWGMGDLKMLAGLGAWVGWQGILPLILVASCSAVAWIYGYGAYKGRRIKKIPFGPFLALGGWLAVLYQHWFWQMLMRTSAW
jgi:leader peptidase (prepilin peptidase)/N-methyltransferase